MNAEITSGELSAVDREGVRGLLKGSSYRSGSDGAIEYSFLGHATAEDTVGRVCEDGVSTTLYFCFHLPSSTRSWHG